MAVHKISTQVIWFDDDYITLEVEDGGIKISLKEDISEERIKESISLWRMIQEEVNKGTKECCS